MTETKSYETIAANVAAVRENMRQAALQAGRDPEEITLVAATKVQTSQTIRNAIQAGITVCGENRVQELVAHLEDDAYAGARVHFIGHLRLLKIFRHQKHIPTSLYNFNRDLCRRIML